MKIEPRDEHRWLQRMVGEWTSVTQAEMEPGKEPVRAEGTESVRAVGDLWVMCEGRMEMPGCDPDLTVMTLGFDPERGRFVGSFMGSMMTHLWRYEGELDATGQVLELRTEGPSFTTPGAMAPYLDRIELRDDGTRVLSSAFQDADGSWHPFMTATYTRAG